MRQCHPDSGAGIPPSSVESENEVLGSIIADSNLWVELKDRISVEAFYETRNQKIVRAFFQMSAEGIPVDLITLYEWFKKNGGTDLAEGSSHWTWLTEVALGLNLDFHLDQINETYRQRLLWEKHYKVIAALENRSIQEAEQFQAEINDLQYSDTGTGCITLAKHKPTARTWILNGLFPDRFPSIIYGAGGIGKSFLALHMSILACLGGETFIGYPFPKEPLNVLIVDYELDPDSQAERAGKLARGLDLAGIPPNLHYYEPKKRLSKAFPEIRGLIKRHSIRLLIVDSIGASGTDGESPSDVVSLLTELKNLGIATIVLDHQAKLQAGEKYGNKTPFGSVYKENLARSVFQLSRVEAEGNRMTLKLTHRKTNFSKFAEDLMFDMTFEGDLVLFAESKVKTPEAKELELVREAITDLEKMGVRANQGAVIEQLKGVLSKDKVTTLLEKGDGELWNTQPGERKEILYNSINPKNGSIYNTTFGFMENGDYKNCQTDQIGRCKI